MKSHKTYILSGIMLGALSIAPNTHTAAEAPKLESDPTKTLRRVIMGEASEKVSPFPAHVMEEGVADLLQQGANAKAVITNGDTLLHRVHNPVIAKLLLEYNAQLEAKNDAEKTPLQTAVCEYLTVCIDSTSVIEFLLRHGANKNAPWSPHSEPGKSIYEKLVEIPSLGTDDGWSETMIERARNVRELFDTIQ